jgi:hypothetical protein
MKAAAIAVASNLQERERGPCKSAASSFAWWMAVVGLAAIFLLGNYPLLSGRQALIWDAEDLFAPATPWLPIMHAPAAWSFGIPGLLPERLITPSPN